MARDVIGQEPRHGGHGGRPSKHAPGQAAQQRIPVEQPHVATVTGHEERRGEARREPPRGKPPVGVHYLGIEATRDRPQGSAEPQQVGGQGDGGERCQKGSGARVAAVAHALERVRRIAEPVDADAVRVLVARRVADMRCQDLDRRAAVRGGSGKAGDVGAGGVALEARIVVRDHQKPHRASI